MKVILLQDIPGIGKKHDIREVSDGYSRNYLLPNKLAKIATDNLVKNIENQKIENEKEKEEVKKGLIELAKKIENTELHFYPKIGKKQEIYASITKSDIIDALKKKLPDKIQKEVHIKIEPDKSIKTLGEHKIEADFGQGIKTKFKVILNQETIQ